MLGMDIYPQMALTDTTIRQKGRPQVKAFKLADGGGLFLYVTPPKTVYKPACIQALRAFYCLRSCKAVYRQTAICGSIFRDVYLCPKLCVPKYRSIRMK